MVDTVIILIHKNYGRGWYPELDSKKMLVPGELISAKNLLFWKHTECVGLVLSVITDSFYNQATIMWTTRT